ncbi:hypothetical protein PR048_018759 [Dryococelus australis]|uniref:Uncharacterized protein n=1 Tax=Dryococelus australis TaxID=614101 RepID=A0ABQ9HD73_9NEOP|nr:hypothetical protein PR048_018759 [Dryococelus australis]
MLCKVTECKIPLSLALLDYRNTPFAGIGLSPDQMHLHHCLKSKSSTHSDILKPHVYSEVPARLRARQHSRKCYYDWSVGNKRTPTMIAIKFDAPGSYLLKTLDSTVYRRNRKHFRAVPNRLSNKAIM